MLLVCFLFKGFNFMFQTQQDTKTETTIQNDKIPRLNVNFSNFVAFNILEQTLGQAVLKTNKSRTYN